MATKKKSPTTTRSKQKKVKVDIDLSSVKANADQIKRLKALVSNSLLTWMKSDVCLEDDHLIICIEKEFSGRRGPKS